MLAGWRQCDKEDAFIVWIYFFSFMLCLVVLCLPNAGACWAWLWSHYLWSVSSYFYLLFHMTYLQHSLKNRSKTGLLIIVFKDVFGAGSITMAEKSLFFFFLFPNAQTWNNTYSHPDLGMDKPPTVWMPIDLWKFFITWITQTKANLLLSLFLSTFSSKDVTLGQSVWFWTTETVLKTMSQNAAPRQVVIYSDQRWVPFWNMCHSHVEVNGLCFEGRGWNSATFYGRR